MIGWSVNVGELHTHLIEQNRKVNGYGITLFPGQRVKEAIGLALTKKMIDDHLSVSEDPGGFPARVIGVIFGI